MSAHAAQRRLGGPVHAHGRAGGLWSDPLPWAFAVTTLVWLATWWRQRPCQQTDILDAPNPYLRLCYSDIPVIYRNTRLWEGARVYSEVRDLEQPVLTGWLMSLARTITGWFGMPVRPGLSAARVLATSHVFVAVTAVLLFASLLVLVASHLLMGRTSASAMADTLSGRVRSWDALMVAAAPTVFTAGLISWDLFGVALTSLALLLWALRRPVVAGIVLGLAVSALFYPLLVLVGIGLLCVRAGQEKAFTRLAGFTALTWALLNIPVIMLAPQGWAAFFVGWYRRPVDMGSGWFLLAQLHLAAPFVTVVSVALMLAWLAGVAQLVARAPRRPRVAQVVLLLVVGFLVINKVYSPQHALWLLPLVVLARPVWRDWAIWSVAEAIYWWAVWGHLGGQSAPGDGGPDVVYWLAILVRVLAELWLAARVVHDIRNPWDDPVRLRFVDDPIGGVLDHAPDAGLVDEAPLSLMDLPERADA